MKNFAPGNNSLSGATRYDDDRRCPHAFSRRACAGGLHLAAVLMRARPELNLGGWVALTALGVVSGAVGLGTGLSTAFVERRAWFHVAGG